jgi:hypothetical protein
MSAILARHRRACATILSGCGPPEPAIRKPPPELVNVKPDDPLRLDVAAALTYPDIKPSSTTNNEGAR